MVSMYLIIYFYYFILWDFNYTVGISVYIVELQED
jgi:hypothetical protein